MELRKLQLVGRASFSVTLPPDWIKENKLKPSDQITITQEEDGSLRLVPGIIREGKEVKITIDVDRCKEPGLLGRLIIGGYIRGCDLIEVVSKHTISQDHRREINNAVNGLMGLGIIESTSNHVTIQSMVDHSKFPMRPLLKRLCELASSMYEDALQALKDKDPSMATDIMHRKDEAKKIFWLTQRQLASAILDKNVLKKIGLKGSSDLAFYRAVSSRMNSIADSGSDIADNLLTLGKNRIKDADLQNVMQLGKLAQEIISNACESFFNGGLSLANSTVEAINHFEKTKVELMKKVGPRIEDVQVAMCLMTIIRDMRNIAECGKTIAEMTIVNFTTEKNNLP